MKIAVLSRSGSDLQYLIRAKAIHNLGEVPRLITLDYSFKQKLRLALSIHRRMGLLNLFYFVLTKYLESRCVLRFISSRDRKFKDKHTSFESQSEEVLEFFREENFDLVVLGQSMILPSSLLQLLDGKVVNVHPAKLPDYRGYAEPAHALLANQPSNVGFSLHLVNSTLDGGDMIDFVEVATLPFDTLNMRLTKTRILGYEYLFSKLSRTGLEQFLKSASPQNSHGFQTVSILPYQKRLVLDLRIFISRIKYLVTGNSNSTF
jgi:folate-dependent phosphoribosylglycinamide formyltransferase PurN